ncbi:hypothetical protein [Lysobacter gummosus]|uniref:hypothetical protein n=1 Tax=Lysobacter gummosus TaxID=262324 RepID=UPI003637027E
MRRGWRFKTCLCCRLSFLARHSRERGLRFTSAEPNIQRLQTFSHERPWIPAFAGMTALKDVACLPRNRVRRNH